MKELCDVSYFQLPVILQRPIQPLPSLDSHSSLICEHMSNANANLGLEVPLDMVKPFLTPRFL